MADYDPISVAQFWAKVEVRSEGVCWFWQGQVTNGYGKFRDIRAHRYAYEFAKGQIGDGLLVRHMCGNKLCVNPTHLEVGTMADNAQDGIALGETLRGERNGRSKLDAEQVHYVRDNPDRLSGRNLAIKFGVSPATISMIRSGRRWLPPHEATTRNDGLTTRREVRNG